MPSVPRVVVLGGGFGGLACARALRDEPVEVVLVDPRNYHLFTPLLYQVASCLLNPSEVAIPIRKIFRRVRNVHYRMAAADRIDLQGKVVHLDDATDLAYDYLVITTGSVNNYFGNASIEQRALGLKNLTQSIELRDHVLCQLERAAVCADPAERQRMLTFCIVGGGPTGVEYAGALAELARLVLPHEYPEIAPAEMRILLLEGAERLLSTFVPALSRYTSVQLGRLGVEVRMKTLVASADDIGVVLHDGEHVATENVVWTAGVRPNDPLHIPPERITVDDQLRIPDAPGALAIGDVAKILDKHGRPLPMLSPVAMQGGRYVARHILDGGARRPFRYRDKGTLATIGRRKAVGQVGPVRFRGFIGWLAWLVVHLYYLIGFENRLQVLLRWAWYYFRLDRPVRIIIRPQGPRRE
jgi:NADH dehydrogenase